MKISAAVAVLALTLYPAANALAQGKAVPAPAKASMADVQKVVNAIKADKAKMTQFCALHALQVQYSAATDKKDEKVLAELDKKMDAASKALGDEYERVTSADLDDASSQLLDALGATCK